MSEVKPPRSSEETLTPLPVVEVMGREGIRGEVLAYARADEDGETGPSKVATLLLPMAILYGACLGTLVMSVLGGLPFVFMHVGVCLMTVTLGYLVVKVIRRGVRMGAGELFGHGVAVLGLMLIAAMLLPLRSGVWYDDWGLGMLGAGLICLAVGARRHVPRYVMIAGWAEPIDAKLAWSLRRFGVVLARFELAWFGVCGVTAWFHLSPTMWVLPRSETVQTVLVLSSLIGAVGFLFCWMWMLELHGKLFKVRRQLSAENQVT